MRINNISNTNFKGVLNNKLTLSALEKISDHSATFSTAVAVGSAMFLRPLAINLTPDVKKENKQHSVANSISSGLVKLLVACSLSVPIEKAIKNIEKSPKNFLNTNSINFLKDKNAFNFSSQILKHSSNLITAIPKTALTVSLIPFITEKILKKKEKPKENKKEINFKGSFQDGFNKAVSKYFNSETVQNLSKKYSANSKNIVRDMTVLTDMLLTGSFIFHTKTNKNIDPERKNNLIYNNIISTGLSAMAGIGIDKAVQKQSECLINKFIEANKTDPKLSKYLQGINVLRPTLIFALIYYGIFPVISNYFAQKISDNNQKK